MLHAHRGRRKEGREEDEEKERASERARAGEGGEGGGILGKKTLEKKKPFEVSAHLMRISISNCLSTPLSSGGVLASSLRLSFAVYSPCLPRGSMCRFSYMCYAWYAAVVRRFSRIPQMWYAVSFKAAYTCSFKALYVV
jgi:hypothetical protein